MAQFRPLIEACREAIRGLKQHNVDARELLVCAAEWPNAEGLTVLGVPVVLRSFGRGWVDARGRRDNGFGLGFTAPIGELREGWPLLVPRVTWECNGCGACCRALATGLLSDPEAARALDSGDGVCRHLERSTNRCSIYETRPACCRVTPAHAPEALAEGCRVLRLAIYREV